MRILPLLLIFFLVSGGFAQEIKKENLSKKASLFWDFNRTQLQAIGSYYVDELGETTEKHGKWLYYNRLGDLEEERNYYKDLLQGKAVLYYGDNKPKQEGYFYMDRQDSIYREWHENGKLAVEGNYKLGEAAGVWKYFYFDGSEKSMEETKAGVNYIWSFWLPDKEHTQTVTDGEGEITTYFSTGKVKEWYNYKNGLKNGPFEEFSIYGYTALKGFFREGDKDSTWSFYYYTGELEKTSTYRQGSLDGPYKYYYDNGKLNVEGNYTAGKKEGVWTWYTNQGIKDQEGTFKEDLQHGQWIYWYPTGEVSYTARYDRGLKSGQWTYLYQNGEKFKEGTFVNDEKDGIWKTWYEDGTLLMEGAYSAGKEQGLWKNYWENGTLKNETTFKQGLMNGSWSSYFPSGKLKLSGKYKDNYKVGKWTNYFENGKPKDEVTYKIIKEKSKVDFGIMKKRVRMQSIEHGHAVYYSDKDFRKTEEGNFSNGKKDGEWIAYYPGGKTPAVISNFKEGELNGIMKNFDRRGNLLQEMEYKDGLKHGRFVIYDKKGKPLVEKRFEYGMEVIKDERMTPGSFVPN
ncbi:MAG: toxin-antitoxin system YwqK family antitoxin [Bacteroidota bacterium]